MCLLYSPHEFNTDCSRMLVLFSLIIFFCILFLINLKQLSTHCHPHYVCVLAGSTLKYIQRFVMNGTSKASFFHLYLCPVGAHTEWEAGCTMKSWQVRYTKTDTFTPTGGLVSSFSSPPGNLSWHRNTHTHTQVTQKLLNYYWESTLKATEVFDLFSVDPLWPPFSCLCPDNQLSVKLSSLGWQQTLTG